MNQGHLVLSRNLGEAIIIGTPPNEITVTVVRVRGNTVRLGIEAPKRIPIRRAEVEWEGEHREETDEEA